MSTTALIPQLTEDEAKLYDRQIRLWGVDAQRRMRAAKILLIGFKGLNAEVCKNIVLAGVNSVTLLEWEAVSPADIGANFFLSFEHIGKNRGTAALPNISELNPLVHVHCDEGSVEGKDEKYFQQFNIVCATNCPLQILNRVDSICRNNPTGTTYFFAGDNFGYFGYFFEDLNFYTYTIKKPKEKQDSDTHLPHHHDDSANMEIEKKEVKFPSLQDAFSIPWNSHSRDPKLFFGIHCLFLFFQQHNRLPTPHNTQDSDALVAIAKNKINEEKLDGNFLSEQLVRDLATNASSEISPVCAIIGGILGQEIIKVISGDEPLNNFFFYNAQDPRQLGLTARIPK